MFFGLRPHVPYQTVYLASSMDTATLVLSRQGVLAQNIDARHIRSREHYRKLWPLVTLDPPAQLVTWVSPTFDADGHCERRSHFRRQPEARLPNLAELFAEEEAGRRQLVTESPHHRRAKALLGAELRRRIEAGLGLQWAFRDEEASDFPLLGNLLLGASDVQEEYPLQTPFGREYRLDLAVLAPPIGQAPVILGGVEIEFGHAFDGRKAILGRSMGFPLITVDISDLQLDDLTPEWAFGVLQETTATGAGGRRRSYLYVHDLLYPLFAQIPPALVPEQRHQFLVFAPDAQLQQLQGWLQRLARALEYPANAVAVAVVNATNAQAQTMLERAGAIAGADWRSYNERRCLRLTLPRPAGPHDLRSHLFHMTLARLLLTRTDALVGYMHENGHINARPDEPVWTVRPWDRDTMTHGAPIRILPKRLAEPVSRLLQVIAQVEQGGA